MSFEKVRELIADTMHCDPAKVTPAASLKEDLGMDSLDAMELSMALEDTFSIKIDEVVLKSFVTVGDVTKYLDSLEG